jgi:sugar phosphate isomerase/epimerase
MGEPITWIGIAALTVSNIGIWIDKLAGARRRNGKNGANKKLCEDHTAKLDEHGTAITELKTHRENMDEKIDLWRKENREDHKSIFDKLDGLSTK